MTRWQFPTDQLTPDEIALVIRLDAAIGALDPERLRADFRTAVKDFYLTNPIARASALMGELSAMAAERARVAMAAE